MCIIIWGIFQNEWKVIVYTREHPIITLFLLDLYIVLKIVAL